ncbi:ComEA family DNA-binding protein [Chondrinema litorale]|uniref:ComEA family DNA-binding protein n=1 Tax=Chondrinema litorale TaxID=2994555 RepID=UPI002543C4C5|nr:helix-hairpin-helix domain-containing protein [Chondrinema litorale]UZR92273.1 helix-hairpin-helix domain-containing protein [Chondrinema litorale]
MRRIKNFLIQAFDFSPVEVRGFFVLMVIISISLILPTITKVILSNKEYSPEADQKLLDSLLATLDHKEPSLAKVNIQTSSETQIQLFKFDPNQASLSDLTLLGINDFLAKRIVKYRSKGGKFYKKEDLLKIYGFPDSLYSSLEDYIAINSIAKKETFTQKDKDGNSDKKEVIASTANTILETEPLELIDINLADTTQLKVVRGIGSKLAARIVSFRSKLGGFHDNNQLKEVYGLKPEVCDALLVYAEVKENAEINKISINLADAKSLQSHPYISWKEANIIVKYRAQHGDYKKPEDLANIKILDDTFIKKIAPYLSFE